MSLLGLAIFAWKFIIFNLILGSVFSDCYLLRRIILPFQTLKTKGWMVDCIHIVLTIWDAICRLLLPSDRQHLSSGCLEDKLRSFCFPHMLIAYCLCVCLCVCVCVGVCTVTDFCTKNKASGIIFCMAVHRRPRQGISHFGVLCSPEVQNQTNWPALGPRPPACKCLL